MQNLEHHEETNLPIILQKVEKKTGSKAQEIFSARAQDRQDQKRNSPCHTVENIKHREQRKDIECHINISKR